MSSRHRTKTKSGLPRWARVKKRSPKRADMTVAIPDEELYLRTRCYVEMSRSVDRALETALVSHMGPLVTELHRFFLSVSPWQQQQQQQQTTAANTAAGRGTFTTDDASTSRKRPRIDCVDTSEDSLDDDSAQGESLLFTFHPPQRYSAELLPVAVLHGPPCMLDRHELMHHLYAKLIHGGSLRPAVCWLRRFDARQATVATLLQEVFRQCLEQDDDVSSDAATMLLHRLRKKRGSAADALLEWAKECNSMLDSIVIMVEGVDTSTMGWQDFLQCLSTLRSQHGVQVCLLMCLSPGAGASSSGLRLPSSVQGMAGIAVKEYALPSSHVLYDSIWNTLWIDRPLPVSIAPALLRSMRATFVHQNCSVTHAIMALKKILAHQFMERGSFMRGADSVPGEEDRMQWFHVDEEAQNYAFSKDACTPTSSWKRQVQESSDARSAFHTVLSVIAHVVCETKGDDNPDLHVTVQDLLEQSFSDRAYATSSLRSKIISLFRRSSSDSILKCLIRYRRKFDESDEAHRSSSSKRRLPPQLSTLYERLNELIVLVDRSSRDPDEHPSWSKELSEMMEAWIYDVYCEGSKLLSARIETSPAVGSSIGPELRRSIAEALLDYAPASSQDRDVSTLPSELFSLIRDCVVVSREEWFRRFWTQSPGEETTVPEMWSQFALGVYQLEFLGLIQEKSGQTKSERVYEKTALVWCIGE